MSIRTLHPAHFAAPTGSVLDRYARQFGRTRPTVLDLPALDAAYTTESDRQRTAKERAQDRNAERKAKQEVRRG